MSWDDLEHKVILRAGRVVAIVVDGGAIVEAGDIEYREGRQLNMWVDGPDGETIDVLRYFAGFGVAGADDPDCSEAVEADIVLTGTVGEQALEIRGRGWFGYDEKGNFEGWFDNPPTIIAGERRPASRSEPSEADQEFADMLRRRSLGEIPLVEPKPSAEYLRAQRGRYRAEPS